jgi:hypothetical protein
MIKLKTSCDDCYHKKVCRNKGNAEKAIERLFNSNYSEDPHKFRPWSLAMEDDNVDIVFSCPDFRMGHIYIDNGYRR